jgi:uncharacterized protein
MSRKRDTMAGKYEIFADEPAGFRFRLKASNGDVAVTSENYKTKKSVQEGLERFRRNAASEKVDDLTLEWVKLQGLLPAGRLSTETRSG